MNIIWFSKKPSNVLLLAPKLGHAQNRETVPLKSSEIKLHFTTVKKSPSVISTNGTKSRILCEIKPFSNFQMTDKRMYLVDFIRNRLPKCAPMP